MNWQRVIRHQYRRSTFVAMFCGAVLAGIGLTHSGRLIGVEWWWLCLSPALFLLRRRNAWAMIWFVALGLSLGWWRGSVYMEKLAEYQPLFGHRVTLRVTANQDAVYNKYQQLTFDAHGVSVEPDGKPLKGKVTVNGYGMNAVFAGDEVLVGGVLKPSQGVYQARLSYAQFTLVAHHNSVILELRRRFASGVQSTLPEPAASFGMGLLVGQRNTLSDEVTQAFRIVGLTHIIAVSGYNLTILLHAAEKTTGRFSKRLGTFIALGMIALFLLLTGAGASIVRAAVISVMSIAAGYYGRQFKPMPLILLGAAITAYASPFYLWGDVSWYLSFLAFFGVMLLAPLLSRNWPTRWKESVVIGVVLESFSAEIMTLPLILHLFGQMSFVNLLSNMLVTALIPLAMLLTFIAGLAGIFAPLLAGWLAWPARWLLTYMVDVALALSRWPHIFLQNLGFTVLQMLTAYGITAALVTAMYFKNSAENATITDRTSSEQPSKRRAITEYVYSVAVPNRIDDG